MKKRIDDWNQEDTQFWNYNWDYKGYELDDIPRWKSPPPDKLALFEWKRDGKWLLPGPPQYSSKAISIIKHNIEPLQLASPSLEVFHMQPINGNFNNRSHKGHNSGGSHERRNDDDMAAVDGLTMRHLGYGYMYPGLFPADCFSNSGCVLGSSFVKLLHQGTAVIAQNIDLLCALSDTSYSVNSLKTVCPHSSAAHMDSTVVPRGNNDTSYSKGICTPPHATMLSHPKHPNSHSTTSSPDRDQEMEDTSATLDESSHLPSEFSAVPPTERNVCMIEKLTVAIKEAQRGMRPISCWCHALDMTCIQSVSQCFIVGGIL